MKRCVKCAEKIQSAAEVCRFCQAPQPPAKKGNFALIGIAAIIGVIAFGKISSGDKAPEEGATASIAATASAAPKPSGPSAYKVEIMALQRLKDSLKDPDSMTTRNISVPVGAGYLCGEVNSRNGFGGMTGYKRFIAGAASTMPVAIDGETMESLEFQKSWQDLC